MKLDVNKAWVIFLLVLWGILGQIAGAFLVFWLTGIEADPTWWKALLGFVGFSLGGIAFVTVAALVVEQPRNAA